MVAVVAVAATAVMGEATPAEYQKVLADRSSAFVTIKFVLQVKMGGMGDNESEMEITGVMIDPKGLVLTSNTQLGGIGGMMRQMGREITTTPTSIKVLVGDDTEGLEAKLIARDTELDLAWVQIKDAGNKKFDAINLASGTTAKAGQVLIGIRRAGKFLDRIPVIVESRVAGVAKKPREMYVPTLPLSSVLGLPVFTSDGKVLGVAIMQMPSDEDEDQNPAAMFSRMSSMQEMMYGFVLPAKDVVEATQRAKQTAATQPVDDEKAAPAKPQGGQMESDDQ
jgi:hypothetical protein